jgi:predicted nucleic acid-binding Zn ribbon protein
VQKVFHPVGIIFKGTGWHITDYRGNGGNGKKAKETASTEKEKKEEKEEA